MSERNATDPFLSTRVVARSSCSMQCALWGVPGGCRVYPARKSRVHAHGVHTQRALSAQRQFNNTSCAPRASARDKPRTRERRRAPRMAPTRPIQKKQSTVSVFWVLWALLGTPGYLSTHLGVLRKRCAMASVKKYPRVVLSTPGTSGYHLLYKQVLRAVPQNPPHRVSFNRGHDVTPPLLRSWSKAGPRASA